MQLIQTADKNGIPTIFIYENNKEVGYIGFLINKNDKIIYLYHLLIKREYRRKGLANSAMNLFIKEFSEFDIHLHVADYSEAAKEFWDEFFQDKNVFELKDKNSFIISNKRLNLPKYHKEKENDFYGECY